VFKFDNPEEKIKIFFNASVAIKVNKKLISDGEVEIDNSQQLESYTKWLDEQVKYIKEYISDFNENNKEYYNSLKVSDSLYKKYIGYFKNEKLLIL
jgi:ABC-type lipoprotein release transport system permease subunit